MNKNQKNVPYSFSKLIYGNKIVIAFHQSKIDRLERQIAKGKRDGKDVTELVQSLAYHRSQKEYFVEENSRFSLCRACCGDATVLVK